jgi:hypothetical protein
MGEYKIKTNEEEDKKIQELKEIFNEKTSSKIFKKLLNLKFSIEK